MIDPTAACGVTERHCPLLRTCACCGFRFVTTWGRVRHQNTCPEQFQFDVAEAQYLHKNMFHTRQRRRPHPVE
jgi:hypothetical protein